MLPMQSKHRQQSSATTTGSAASIFSIFWTQRILAYASAQSRYSQNWLIKPHTAPS